MKLCIGRLSRMAMAFWRDTSGLMLPYMTVMLPVLVGFGLLALDGARFMSLQTQMQAAADALALAGARELDQTSGAQTRAANAMANAYESGAVPNTLSGMGTSPTLSYNFVFYSSLPAATAGLTGIAATGDADSKYVKVTVNAQSVPTIFPVSYFSAGAVDSFATGASAIAGFTGITICDMPPVFVCNPYETAGMSDKDATAALRTNLAPGSWTLRQQLRMDTTSTSPGHFGFLVPPDGCTGASCLAQWIGATTPKACFTSTSVSLNTGQKNSVNAGFNVRFDLYQGGSPLNQPSAAYAPSVNVRKGFLPRWNKNGDWCSATTTNPYYTTQSAYATPIVTTTGSTGSNTTITNIPAGVIGNIFPGQLITGTCATGNVTCTTGASMIPTAPPSSNATIVTAVNTASSQITISNAATGTGTANLTIKWETSGLPLDSNLYNNPNSNVFAGNGQWDCANYWAINHPSNPTLPTDMGGTCSTPANTTVSRYQVYRYEIANSATASKSENDWSGNGLANRNNGDSGNAVHNGYPGNESGAPYCAIANGGGGVDDPANNKDRRRIPVAVINCLAQSGLITGGSTAQNIPVAGFAEVFLTQPVGADATNYLYAEMTCLIGECPGLSSNKIWHQVQLYR